MDSLADLANLLLYAESVKSARNKQKKELLLQEVPTPNHKILI